MSPRERMFCGKFWSEIKILVKNRNFGQKPKIGQKWKFWAKTENRSKIEILVKNGKSVKNRNFSQKRKIGQKSKFWSKTENRSKFEILVKNRKSVKNRNFGQKLKFWFYCGFFFTKQGLF